MMLRSLLRLLAVFCASWVNGHALAYSLSEALSVESIAAAAIQCQSLANAPGAPNSCRGGTPVQTELIYRPNERGTLALKLGLTAGVGLGPISPFALSPWAADLRDEVTDINGSGRNYLLTAWYQHRYSPQDGIELAATIGLIDATDFLDNNAYANDEYTQLMNEALVNGPNAYLPSYDPGAAMELDAGKWSLSAVGMRVHDPDGGYFLFLGGQLAYVLNTRVSDGYDAVYTGGIDVGGSLWGRTLDNIGLGVGYLSGSTGDAPSTSIGEIYYRWVPKDFLALTADLQYLREHLRNADPPQGFVFGARLTLQF